MAEPTEKSPEIEKFLSAIFGVSRREVIENNQCATCNADATKFRDEESEREYRISGMCQKCQDKVWG